jgi:putative oxidoreductase
MNEGVTKDDSRFDDGMDKWALLVLRGSFGGLLAGHGGQKLFGWFGGHGWQGTRQWMRSLGFHPSRGWTAGAVASEFGGGVLTALGFLDPLGPILTLGSMGMATARVHWGKPIWVSEGGAELPITNLAIATALLLSGPGAISLDGALGTKLPRWIALPGAALALAGVAYGAWASRNAQQAAQQAAPQPQAEAPQSPAPELQAAGA